LVDVDDFKHINDTRGHLMGDVALKKIASVVKASIRKVDIAGRYGDDEFLILLPEAIMDNARTVALRILLFRSPPRSAFSPSLTVAF
jgi:diguanylate cyclase (GGDEF)-like protein